MKKSKLALSLLGFTLLLTATEQNVYAQDGLSDKLRIAVVNVQPVWGDKQANLTKILKYSEQAASMGAKMIVFPEMVLTGYAMENGDVKRLDRMQVKLAESENGEAAKTVAEKAQKLGVYIA